MAKYIGIILVQVNEEKPVLFTSTKKAHIFLTDKCGVTLDYDSFKVKIQEGNAITLFSENSEDYHKVYMINDHQIDPE